MLKSAAAPPAREDGPLPRSASPSAAPAAPAGRRLVGPLTGSGHSLAGHIPAIDGLRGLIIFVLINHYNFLGDPGNPFELVYLSVVQLGQLSLDTFFVVSGFLITGILFDSKGGAGYFRNYYIRRTLRIFPLYYAFLVLWFVVLPLLWPDDARLRTPLEHQAWYWSYLTNFYVAYNGGDAVPPHTAHLWSLAVEEQFYLLWPLVIFLLGKRALMAICVGCIAIAPLFRTWLLVNGHTTEATYMLMPTRMDSIAVGALLALLARGERGLLPLRRWLLPVSAALLAAALVVLGVSFWDVREPIVKTVGYSISALLGGAALVMALTDRPGTPGLRLLTGRAQRTIGTYAYAIYVFHWPLEYVLAHFGLTPELVFGALGFGLPGQLVYTVLMTLLSIGAGALSWHLLEKHVLKLKRFFPYNRAGARRRERAPEPEQPVAALG
jgi:peptidoglycan/LPS O-acetylase OafA/YrhL